MRCSGCFPPLQHSLQLKTTSLTNSSLLPQPHVLLLHHTGSGTLVHPQMVLSPSLPVYLSQLLSILKLHCTGCPSCLKPGFCLLSSARATKSLLSAKIAGCLLHPLCLVQKIAGRARITPGAGHLMPKLGAGGQRGQN